MAGSLYGPKGCCSLNLSCRWLWEQEVAAEPTLLHWILCTKSENKLVMLVLKQPGLLQMTSG
jgi:hypothetical protein